VARQRLGRDPNCALSDYKQKIRDSSVFARVCSSREPFPRDRQTARAGCTQGTESDLLADSERGLHLQTLGALTAENAKSEMTDGFGPN
jgi:hypothetical protein